jgi:hypothetical protein
MAPSNLSQVFVINNPDMYSTTTFSNNNAVTGSRLAAWDMDGITNSGTAINVVSALFTSGVPNFKRIQLTQTMPSGNVIATPIIDLKDIKRINYRKYATVAPTVQAQTVTWSGAPTSSKAVMIRIALRTAPTDYNSFANPSNAYNDLSGGGYTFPLVGNFAAGRMIFNIEVPAGTYTTTTLGDYVRTAIAANPTLNAIFVTSGTSTLVLTARHYGVQFDLIAQYSDGSTNNFVTSILSTMPTAAAASNFIVALGDEKKQRARYGNFNRMYFPFAFPEFAQPTFKYDVIEIQYTHSWPQSTGIARAGELNTLRIYAGASSTALSYAGVSTGTEIATVFGYTGGTDSEQLL